MPQTMYIVPPLGQSETAPLTLWRASWSFSPRKEPPKVKEKERKFIPVFGLPGTTVQATLAIVPSQILAFSWPPYIRKCATSTNFGPDASSFTEIK